MMSRRAWICLAVPAALYVLLAINFVFWGGFVGDEGYYAWMSRAVLNGMKPYRDFLCPQMPFMLYVYAAWFQFVGAGIVEGRFLSAILGTASVLLVGLAIQRRAGLLAAMVGGFLLAGSFHFVYDTVVVKTQSLTVFLSACLLFVLAGDENKRPVIRSCVALGLGSLLFFTRLSLLPSLILLWVLLCWQMRHRLWVFAGLFGTNLLVLALGYFWFSADGNMLFGIYRMHDEYLSGGDWSFLRLGWTVKTWIGNQLPIVLFFLCAIILFLRSFVMRLQARASLADLPFLCFLLFSYGGYTLLHWKSVQSYATHQTSVTAFAVVFSMLVLSPFLGRLAKQVPVFSCVAFALLLCLPLPFGEWSVHWNGNGSNARIRDVVALIQKHSAPGDTLLTLCPELAVESGRKLPVVCGLGEFSYIADLPDAMSEKFKVMNFRELEREIESGRNQMLCLGNREFAILARGDQGRAMQLKEAMDRKYQMIGSIKNYGQFDQELFVYEVRE